MSSIDHQTVIPTNDQSADQQSGQSPTGASAAPVAGSRKNRAIADQRTPALSRLSRKRRSYSWASRQH